MGKITVDDDFVMPFGKYKGKKMVEIPANYLLWLLREEIATGKVKLYIEQNKTLLEKEVNKPAHPKNNSFRDNEYRR